MEKRILLLLFILSSVFAFSQQNSAYRERNTYDGGMVMIENEIDVKFFENNLILENAEGQKAIVFNMIGNIVIEHDVVFPKEEISLEGLSRGVYFLKIGKVSKKFVR